ncbi:hypothetical protein AAVH_22892 [Aphelenchoides avenae]|nr:hypothetical protein AAVH_22892 [Aphelenchus avenae]
MATSSEPVLRKIEIFRGSKGYCLWRIFVVESKFCSGSVFEIHVCDQYAVKTVREIRNFKVFCVLMKEHNVALEQIILWTDFNRVRKNRRNELDDLKAEMDALGVKLVYGKENQYKEHPRRYKFCDRQGSGALITADIGLDIYTSDASTFAERKCKETYFLFERPSSWLPPAMRPDH